MTRALLLCVGVKSGRIALPPNWEQALRIARSTLHRRASEARDLAYAFRVLDDLMASLDICTTG